MTQEPRFRRLAREGLVTLPTLTSLEARERPLPAPRFFSSEEFAALAAFCDVLKPYPSPDGETIALTIDARLAEGKGDGWRYDALPDDATTYRAGLAALRGATIDEARVRRLWAGEEGWSISSRRFLEEVLAEVATAVYSRPEGQDRIGYVGYADAKGWNPVGLGAKESWE